MLRLAADHDQDPDTFSVPQAADNERGRPLFIERPAPRRSHALRVYGRGGKRFKSCCRFRMLGWNVVGWREDGVVVVVVDVVWDGSSGCSTSSRKVSMLKLSMV